MNPPYLPSPTSSHWWSRSKSSSKLTKEKLPEASALSSRTFSPLQPDTLVVDHPPKQSSMFGNFTSVIRLKPKKIVNTVPVQEPPKAPPPPLIIPPSNSSEPYGPLTSRPYSKAISAVTATDDDSIAPKTPLDSNSTYQKPLVDSDLFAAAEEVLSKQPQSLGQLFVAPDSHVPKDVLASPARPQKAQRRHRSANPSVPRERLMSEATMPPLKPAVTVRWVTSPRHNFPITLHSLPRTQPDVLTTPLNPRTRKASMNDIPALSAASATLPTTDVRSRSKATDWPRPHTRPRGMTDNTGIRPSFRKDVDRPSLLRRPSSSRSIVTPPETSPPSHELPPVPSLKSLPMLPNPDGTPSDPGSSSSSLSFASGSEHDLLSKYPFAEDRRLQSIRDQVKAPSELGTKPPACPLRRSPFKHPISSDDCVKSAKKMPSQPSFQARLAVSPSACPDELPEDTLGPAKLLKKQQSFHLQRAPALPLPSLRHATSFTPSEPSLSLQMDSPERQKEKRESTASLSKRRFLPGSMRRGSSTQMTAFTFDDDTGSPIIAPSELDRHDKSLPRRSSNPFGSPGVESMMLPATSTFYDDLASSPTGGSHFPQSTETQSQDTTPQRILSTAQLLQLEEMLENDDSEVSTDPSSRTSPAEFSSPKDQSPVNPPPFEEFGFGSRSLRKKNSLTESVLSSSTIFSSILSDKIIFSDKVETGSTLSFFDQQQHSDYRPRTTSGSLTPVDSSISMKRSHSTFSSTPQSTTSMGIESTFGIEPNQPLGGLTPPPRRRPKTGTSPQSTKGRGYRGSMAHIQPLSPPPVRRNTTSTSASSRSTSTRSSPISSPKSPPPAFKNDPLTRGIMKKPSFLEIDDDVETEAGTRVRVGDIHKRSTSILSVDDSFLDLGHESHSFDTVRTLSAEGPG